jgi:hypothetical protein
MARKSLSLAKKFFNQTARFVKFLVVVALFLAVGPKQNHGNFAGILPENGGPLIGVESIVGEQNGSVQLRHQDVVSFQVAGLFAGDMKFTGITERVNGGVNPGAQSATAARFYSTVDRVGNKPQARHVRIGCADRFQAYVDDMWPALGMANRNKKCRGRHWVFDRITDLKTTLESAGDSVQYLLFPLQAVRLGIPTFLIVAADTSTTLGLALPSQ